MFWNKFNNQRIKKFLAEEISMDILYEAISKLEDKLIAESSPEVVREGMEDSDNLEEVLNSVIPVVNRHLGVSDASRPSIIWQPSSYFENKNQFGEYRNFLKIIIINKCTLFPIRSIVSHEYGHRVTYSKRISGTIIQEGISFSSEDCLDILENLYFTEYINQLSQKVARLKTGWDWIGKKRNKDFTPCHLGTGPFKRYHITRGRSEPHFLGDTLVTYLEHKCGSDVCKRILYGDDSFFND